MEARPAADPTADAPDAAADPTNRTSPAAGDTDGASEEFPPNGSSSEPGIGANGDGSPEGRTDGQAAPESPAEADANGSSRVASNGAKAVDEDSNGARPEEEAASSETTTKARTGSNGTKRRSGAATSSQATARRSAKKERTKETKKTASEPSVDIASLAALSGRRRHRIKSSRTRRWRVPLVTTVAVMVVAAGVAGLVYTMTSSSGEPLIPSSPYSFANGPLKLLVYPANGGTAVPPDSPVSAVTPNARITAVSLTSDTGTVITGSRDIGGHSWQAAPGQLLPSTTYRMVIGLITADGQHTQRQMSFTTLSPQGQLIPKMTPDGGTVGVGAPVVIRFNQPVADQASVQSHLVVKMSIPVAGAWHWFGNKEVHYRPENYWPAGERVTVLANLANVDAGNDIWGTSNHSINFTVGDAHVSTVDLNSHEMTVTDNGKVVQTFPISGGRPQYPSMNGVHVVLGKQQDVLMDSQTVGIPRNSPDGYYEHVYWDVAITTGGEYVHAAPWSVGAQGSTNVSHGCINVGPDNAIWFYNFSQTGDIVQVVGSPRPPTDDPGTADWNMSWDQWVAGSAV